MVHIYLLASEYSLSKCQVRLDNAMLKIAVCLPFALDKYMAIITFPAVSDFFY